MDIKIDRDAFLNEMPDDTVEPEIIDELRKKLIQFTKELESVPEGSVEYKHIMQEAKNYIDKFSALYAERVRLVSRERIIEGFMKSDFPEVKERYLNKEINLNWLINGYNKDSLKWMAKEYLSLSGLSKLKKKELVDLVVEKMQDPDIFMRRVSLLDDECVRIIEHLIKSDGIDILYIKDSVLYGLEASDMVFDVTIAGAMEKDDGHKGIFCIPKEMSDLYAAYCDDAFQERRRRINWILKCAKVASIIYGVLEWDILKKLCAVQYNLTIDELRELFDYIIREENPLCRHKGLLANSMIDSDDVDYLISEQNGKDYYIPGKDEIEEIYAYGAILSNKYAEKMIKHLQKVFKMSEKEARSCTIEIYEMINYNQRMQVIVDRFEENGYIFNSEEDFISFAYVFMEFQNNSRIMHNRGFTPAELSKRAAVRNSGQLSAMPKIGRNDPCPCGSGKKYKNCCGRLN